jgi:hypothetical protein
VYARVRLGVIGLAAAFALVSVVTRTSWASDHEDAPDLVTDRGVDIGDVYAFMRPGSTTHAVLAMTVHPNATATTTFDTQVEYQFRILGYDAATGAVDGSVDTRVTCRFEPPPATGAQAMLCAANGAAVYGTVGTATSSEAGDAMRAWAGLRADPAFGDLAALKSTLADRQLRFADAGTNSFAGKNALAIVVELDVDNVLLANVDVTAGRPLLAVSAVTERL